MRHHQSAGAPEPGAPAGTEVSALLARMESWRAPLLAVALLLLGALTALLAVPGSQETWHIPLIWTPAGLGVGLLLIADERWRVPIRLGLLGLLATVWGTSGLAWAPALGYTLGYAAAIEVAFRRLLVDGESIALAQEGDVSRLIGAAALGSSAATAAVTLTGVLSESPLSLATALAAFFGTAASMILLVPLFLPVVRFASLAGTAERAVSAAITLGTTAVVFSDLVPAPIIFAVMPMFAWHAFRGTLRDAAWMLIGTAAIATTLTTLDIGPVAALGERWGLSADGISAVLQLFVLDCALILLPIAVVVTQQRRATAQATSERRTLERLIESARGSAIIATDRAGRIAVFNPAAEELWDRRRDEVVGELPDGLWSVEELRRLGDQLGAEPVVSELWRASVAQGVSEELWHSQRRDGSTRVAQMVVSPVLDEHGEEAGHLLTATDVTDREMAQAALFDTLRHQNAAVARLRELERVKGDFVATVSHELRTPITNIIGYLELLEDEEVGELGDSQRDIVARVHRNSCRLLTLIEDLLMLSQVESSRLDISPEPVDLRDLARQAEGNLGEVLRGRDLDVSVDLPEQPLTHDVDPSQMVRMLGMLLGNAVKFTPDGGQVGLAVRRAEGGAEIVVRDTGPGIAAEDQEQLFTGFYRALSATEQQIQGAGLGLTIVQAIVALHGGRVAVHSALGEGTEVVVWLPRTVEPARVLSVPAPPVPRTPARSA